MQWPIGKEDNFEGVIDLITMKATYFDGDNGEHVRYEEIPAELKADAEAARHHMLESLSMYSDHLMELLLSEEPVPEELIHSVIKGAVQGQDCTPVFMGTRVQEQRRPAVAGRGGALFAVAVGAEGLGQGAQ